MNKVKLKLSLNFLLVLILLQVGCSIESYGQLAGAYSMYRINPQVILPANSGSTPASELTLMNRQQWIGLEGAPNSFVFSGNFKIGQKFGLGLIGMFDSAGPTSMSTVSADFAFHKKIKNDWTLSSGIRAGISNLALNFDNTFLATPDDPLFENYRSSTKLNIGWGLKIAKGDGFFVSISQPRSLKIKYDWRYGFREVTYLFGMAGTKIKANKNLNIYPTALFRISSGVPVSWDANVLVNYKNKYDLGFNYRNQESWGIRAGIQASKRIYLGYVFEMPTVQLSRVSVQSHELALRFSFIKKVKIEK
jgi:type IX secretion system PorP/SprF family membrane protein